MVGEQQPQLHDLQQADLGGRDYLREPAHLRRNAGGQTILLGGGGLAEWKWRA